MAVVVTDSFSESFRDGDRQLRADNYYRAAQSFTTDAAGTVNKATFYLKKVLEPTGNMWACIYNHTGTYGTNSAPGTVKATSSTKAIADLTTSYQLIDFDFDDTVSLDVSTQYCVGLLIDGSTTDATKYVHVGKDGDQVNHDGNCAIYDGSWTPIVADDFCFYVYVTEAAGTLDDPTNVAAAIVSATGINVTWQHSTISTSASFEVQRQTSPGGSWATI